MIAQFGGQTPLNLAADLERNGVKILGTAPSVIDLAEDRDLFREMMDKLEIPMPESGMAVTVDDALEIAEKIGYPVMVRSRLMYLAAVAWKLYMMRKAW